MRDQGYKENHYSKFNILNSKFLNNTGFTVVEMLVVMTIIAMLFTLSVVSMILAERQTKVKSTAKALQSAIREMANKAITVTPDLRNNTTPTKAWVIKVPGGTGTNTYYQESFTQNDISTLIEPNSSPTDPKPLRTESNVIIQSLAPTVASSNSLYLVFGTPFAKFRAVNGSSISAWSTDLTTKEAYPADTISITSLSPNNKIILRVSEASNPNNYMDVEVNVLSGEASVK
ncbi:MAG: type II secretion system GspH family protein [Patescibacteria group bacterium]|nr:type II secretion system GspH family protein [Patescibacteria group bacterium]